MEAETEMKLKPENLANAEAFGIESQIMQAVEEMAELIQALSKVERYVIRSRKPNTEKVAAVMENAAEEIADVEIMIEQIKYLLGIDENTLQEIKRFKIMRTTKTRMEGNDP